MLVDEEVEVKLSRYNRKRYVNLGYQDAETADSLMVKMKDLPQSYRNKVRVKCDYCGEIKEVGYSAYLRSIAIGNHKYACYNCRMVKHAESTIESRRDHLWDKAQIRAKAEGFKILSNKETIKNNRSRITYSCPRGHIHDMKIANFLSGKGCPECVLLENRERCKHKTEEVIHRIEESGGKIKNPEEYIN